MPHLRKGFPKSGTLGLVTERAAEFHYRFNAETLEYARDVLYLGQPAGRRPVDNFREPPRSQVPPESTRCGGVRPGSDQSENARLDGLVVVLPALQRGIDND